MKRTTKMFLTAIAAVVAVSVMMIAPALAAPACPLSGTNALETATTGSGCPASALLGQLTGGNGGTDLTGLCPNGDCSALLQQYLGGSSACPNGDCTTADCAGGDCTTGACPASGLMQQLLGQYLNGSCADGSCLNGLDCLLTGTCGN
jgi:hypothetical protein